MMAASRLTGSSKAHPVNFLTRDDGGCSPSAHRIDHNGLSVHRGMRVGRWFARPVSSMSPGIRPSLEWRSRSRTAGVPMASSGETAVVQSSRGECGGCATSGQSNNIFLPTARRVDPALPTPTAVGAPEKPARAGRLRGPVRSSRNGSWPQAWHISNRRTPSIIRDTAADLYETYAGSAWQPRLIRARSCR